MMINTGFRHTWVVLAGALMLQSGVPAFADVDFTNENGVVIASENDGTFLRIGGRLHVDGATFNDDVTPLSNDVVFRRARVHLAGRFRNDWRVATDYDFGEIEGFKNAWVRYSGFNHTHITFGNQVAPFSLEETTSSNYLTFMERSVATAFSPGFLVGLTARKWGKKWMLTGGIYGNELNDRQRRKGNGTSVAVRSTWTPMRSKRGHLVHMGLSVEYRNLSDHIVRFRTRPESFVTSKKLIDTGTIRDVDDLTTVGLEAAWRYRRFSLQGEYVRTEVSRSAGNLSFDGGYVATSFFLSKHYRGYRRSSGSFGRFAGGRRNAWQIAARYSVTNLEDKDISGGKERNWTIGLNWFINRHFAVKVDYINADLSPNRKGVNESPDFVQVRLQATY